MVAKAAAGLWPILCKKWPKIVTAFGVIYKFDNLDLPNKIKDSLSGVPQRVVDVQKRGDKADKGMGTPNIVRDVARQAGEVGSSGVDVDHYVRQANGIEHWVRRAAALARGADKQALLHLRAQRDALLGELVKAAASKPNGQQAVG